MIVLFVPSLSFTNHNLRHMPKTTIQYTHTFLIVPTYLKNIWMRKKSERILFWGLIITNEPINHHHIIIMMGIGHSKRESQDGK